MTVTLIKSLKKTKLKHIRPYLFNCLFCLSFLQGIFPTWAPNPGLLHCRCSLLSEPPGKPLQLSDIMLIMSENKIYPVSATCFFRETYLGSPGGSNGEESPCHVGDPGSIPGLGRSPGGGHGNPLQYSCLENPMDGGAWKATAHGVTKSWT